ncbi:filamentous hemagglutinin N-terminal domain-containing protein [Leptolyngbya sp. AN03gr2]|uniref:two-partner secretion domain-containing protein n=1 Tax=unclassified Leptolyngbya TaxID=2650499 RepID=UPI003D312D73
MRINTLAVLIHALFSIFAPPVTVAQIVPDSTSDSKVTSSPNNTQLLITGGSAESRNLFHSFDRFSLGSGQKAIFAPDSSIANIITRVTGTEASRIDGTIAVNGNANLFFINPNGIVFGQNASLAIAGSFFASTDPGWRFTDSVNQSKPPLLTISAPIVNLGNLNVGGDLSIVAGTVSGSGQFTAGNRIGITTNTLTLDRARISAPNGIGLDVQDATLSDSRIDSTVGDIDVNARSFTLLNGATINTSIPANSQGRSGNINLNIQDTLTILGQSPSGTPSGITSTIDGQGIGGNITIRGDSLQMSGGSQIFTVLNGTGQSGSIDIATRNDVQLLGAGSQQTRIGSAVTSEGIGQGGDIRITAQTVSLFDRAKIDVYTDGAGTGGGINVTARDRILIQGTGIVDPIWTELLSTLLVSQNLTFYDGLVRDQGRILFPISDVIASTTKQTGVLAGSATGRTGAIQLNAPNIAIVDQALISSNNWRIGDSGTIRLNATENILVKDSYLFASVLIGRGADLDIDTPNLRLDQSKIVAGTGYATGGTITLNVPNVLLLRNGSTIAARSYNNADGGNVNINAGLIVAKSNENSDIIANASEGRGGNIQITARSMFGIKNRSVQTTESDISASSRFGMSGEVKLTVLQSDPGSEAVKLPTEVTDSSTQIDQTCSARSRINSFTRTGRGGIAPDLAESNRSTPVWIDSRSSQSSAVVEKDTQIVEATGWIRNSAGQIELVHEGSNAQMISPVVCEHKQ